MLIPNAISDVSVDDEVSDEVLVTGSKYSPGRVLFYETVVSIFGALQKA